MSFSIGIGIIQLHYPTHRQESYTDWTQSNDCIIGTPRPEWSGDSNSLANTLADLLADEGLGISLSYKDVGRKCVIRISIVPSDADGSKWWTKKRSQAARTRGLTKLFANLEAGWDEAGGEKLMQTSIEEVNLDMPTLYTNLRSPPEPQNSLASVNYIGPRLSYALRQYESPEGVTATLKPFQVRSLIRMMAMEVNPDTILDPRYTPLPRQDEVGYDEQFFYLNVKDYEVVSRAQRRPFPRGGILCEEPGAGKTLLMLSLIVATLPQPCQPPADHPYHFPKYHAQNRLPTLVEICTSLLTKQYPDMNLEEELPHLDLNAQQYREPPRYMGWTLNEAIRARWGQEVGEKTVEISVVNTSLVVVPAILLAQWQEEMRKHIREGVLRVLVLGMKDEVPSISIVAQYDIVLMEVEVFKRESRLDQASLLCRARWKRIILDEGSTASSKMSGMNLFANKLSVERRWLMSGTPTHNLKQGVDSVIVTANGQTDTTVTTTPSRKQWSNADRDDATRIGNMISGFLDGDLFPGIQTNFQQSITNPLLRKSGPAFGAVARMKELMQCIMVKHRPSDIAQDVELPPLSVSNVKLRFDPLQRLTYNVMVAYLRSNMTIKKKGSTYHLLHNRNGEAAEVAKKLRNACTWYTGDAFLLEDWITAIDTWLNDPATFVIPARRGLERSIVPQNEQDEIRRQLEVNLGYMRNAMGDGLWKHLNMQETRTVPFDVDIPEEIAKSWADTHDEDVKLVGGDALLKLRSYNFHGTNVEELALEGKIFMEVRSGKMAMKAERERKYEKPKAKWHVKARPRSGLAIPLPTSAIDDDPEEGNDKTKKRKRLGAPTRQDEKLLDEPRPLPETIVTYSRSAKVNWVLNTLVCAELDDKFIIFGSHSEIAAISEGLELMDIKAAYFTKSTPKGKRENALKDFEGPEVKVCLMELGLAAQGLTLIMANRMIFLSPVWNPDMQAQAIKRIHRIGQTKECKVDILVTEGTIEELTATRKPGSADDESSYVKSLIANAKYVDVDEIPEARFTMRLAPVDKPAVKKASGAAGKGKGKRKQDEEELEEEVDGDGQDQEIAVEADDQEEPVKKKRKTGKKKEGEAEGKTKGKGKGKQKEDGEADDRIDEGIEIKKELGAEDVEEPVKKKRKPGNAKASKGKSKGKDKEKSIASKTVEVTVEEGPTSSAAAESSQTAAIAGARATLADKTNKSKPATKAITKK